jgi:hypothetical protein
MNQITHRIANLLPDLEHAFSTSGTIYHRATAVNVAENGLVVVRIAPGIDLECEILITGPQILDIHAEDSLLVLVIPGEPRGIVVGRVGRHCPAEAKANLLIEASESITLKCGSASVELRADGKAMVKGDDVLIRAKGTQRIRAGTVSIN